MSCLRRIVSVGAAVVVFVFVEVLSAPHARAQQQPCMPDVPCDTTPPTITISPMGTVTSSPVTITIEWCDDGGLNPSSRVITINGVNRTSSFNYSTVTIPGCWSAGRSSASITLNPGANSVYAYICDFGDIGGPNCGDRTESITFDDKLPPLLSTAPHNGDYRNLALCASACFDAVVSYTTPAYVSLDQARSLTLVYTSAQARALGVVQVDATDNSATPPQKMSIALKRPDGTWVTLTNGSSEVFYQSGAGASRLAAQFDASALATGAYDYTVVVRSWWGTSFEEATAPVRVLVLNEKDSPFGWGWTLAGLQRIHAQADGSAVIAEGDGSVAYFKRTSCPTPSTCTYASPAGDFSTLTGGNGNYYTRKYPDGTELSFLPDGRLRWARDRFSNTTSYNWSSATQLGSIQDPTGVTGNGFYLFYDANGKLREIRALGRSSHVTVQSGNLTHIQDPDGVYALQASYDANRRLTRRTDRRGGQWGFAYDFASKLAADTMPTVTADGGSVRPVVRFRSLETAILADHTAGKGTSSNPAPRVLPGSVRAWVTNPRGFTTNLALDRFGAPTRIEEPLGRTTQLTRNASSQVTRVVVPSGHTVDYTWVGPNLTRIRDVNTTRTIDFTYETTYNQVSEVSGDILRVWNYYSADRTKLDSTRVGTITSKVTRYTYDSRGRLLTATDPEGHVTRYFYASNGLMNTDSVKDGPRRTAFTYDAYGRVFSVKNPLDHVTTTQYDLLNRITRSTGPLSDVTTFEYDALYLTKVTDAKGQVYQFTPNALGWVEIETDPGLRKDRYTYDRNGNLKTWTNRRNQVISYTYDDLDQLTSTTAGGKITIYASDPLGRFVATSNAESTDTLRFDAAGRPEDEITVRAGTRYVLRSSYEKRDLRTGVSMTAGGSHSITYRYDSFMQLDRLTVTGVGNTSIGYNHDRQATSFELPNSSGGIGLTITKQYPSTHIASSVNYSLGAINTAVGVNYRHDLLRHVAQRQRVSGDSVRQFGYDALGQLTRVGDYLQTEPVCHLDPHTGYECYPGYLEPVGDKTYTYDKVGNRTDSGAILTPGNRLTSFAGFSLEYDNDGNLTRKHKTGFDQRLYWNPLGQLDSVWTSGMGTVRFGYDGWGRRVRKSTDAATIRYVWDGDDLFLELNGAGTIQAKYAFYPGTDQPHSVQRGGAVYYYATDFPGNVLGLINRANFSLVNQYRYEPFGEAELTSETVANPLRYAGRELDTETGLYYMRARYYDPGTSRFVSEDPIGLDGGINTYVYAGNNPATFRDPSGLTPCEDPLLMNGDPVCPGEDGLYRKDGCTWDPGQNHLDCSSDNGMVSQEFQQLMGYDLCLVAGCDDVSLRYGGLIGAGTRVAGAAVTLGSTIYFPRTLDPQNRGDVAWLAHEVTHVAQYRMYGPYVYYVGAFADRARDVFGNPYDWRARARSGKPWGRWNMEAQAAVVGECIGRRNDGCNYSPFRR